MHYSIIKIMIAIMTLFVARFALADNDNKLEIKYERVDVAGALVVGDRQHVVVLRTINDPIRYLPIMIGEIEAINIQLRLRRQKLPRPLTLDLLESLISSSNIEVVKIIIDNMQAGIFLSTIVLKRNDRTWNIDARPSDAIGLAVSNNSSIWVAKKVIKNHAFDLDEEESDLPPVKNKSGIDL